jgi:exodeoxyribonuclease V alpha subunit
MTLHRLLEFSPQNGGFGKSDGEPLHADAVIVDETSMLDVVLAAQLFGAVPTGAQLVLVGDVDQLPSVGPGRVLADVIGSRAVRVVRLTEIFRQAAASAIVTNAHRVNRGEMPDLETRPDSDFFFISREEPKDVLATVLEVVAERIGPRFGLDPIDDVQVLTPMHRGDVGAKALNQELQARLNPPGPPEVSQGARKFRVGDKVIQLKNDYDKEVWNGDVGRVIDVVTEDDEVELRVEIDGRSVTYVAQELDQLGHAYALSVHKSQGSEYPAVVIPIVTQHYMMLKRNLLYTGLTRGKRLVVMVGSKKALGIAVRTDDTRMRWTWLAERIPEAIKAATTG